MNVALKCRENETKFVEINDIIINQINETTQNIIPIISKDETKSAVGCLCKALVFPNEKELTAHISSLNPQFFLHFDEYKMEIKKNKTDDLLIFISRET